MDTTPQFTEDDEGSSSPFRRDDDTPAVQRYRLRKVEGNVRNIMRMVSEIHQRQIEIQEVQKNQNICSHPNLCVQLKQDVDELLKDKAERAGAWKTITAAAVAASGLTTIVTSLLGVIHK